MPERLLDALAAARAEVAEARAETHELGDRLRAHRGWVLLLALLVVAVLVLGGLFVRAERSRAVQERLNADRVAAVVECVRSWARAFTERATVLTEAQRVRQQALDDLIRTVPLRDPVRFNAALRAFLVASDAYEATVKKYPVPAVPELTCEILSKPRPLPTVTRPVPGPTVTRTAIRTVPAPVPTVTVTRGFGGPLVITQRATVTETVTVEVPVRGPTRTVTRSVPGPTRTVVVRQTVTRTVPPGRGR